MTFEAGFDHAAHTVIAIFVMIAVLITQMNIDGRDAIAKCAQSILHDTPDPIDQGFTTFDVVVSSDLNLHGALLG
jgi:hypothetical protein